MRYSTLLGLAASLSTAAAQYKGFNYGASFTNNAAKQQADFENEFNLAKNLVGTSGFTSARLYTTIQHGTTNTPISAIQAAINTKTQLLLGLWASAGQENFNNEIAALTAAIQLHGTAFTDLIIGISVGSEDLYRITPTGILNKSGAGAEPYDLVNYIGQLRTAIAGTGAAAAPIGHVDTWTAFANSSNADLVSALDWLGYDGYPYFQNTMANGIANAKALFDDSLGQTRAFSQGKPIWITETGWPVSGPQENEGVANVENAKAYWDEVGCAELFGKMNTFWYTLQDAAPDTPSPSFGLVPAGGNTPLFDLSCPGDAPAASSAAAGSFAATSVAAPGGGAAAQSGAAAAGNGAAAGANGGAASQASSGSQASGSQASGSNAAAGSNANGGAAGAGAAAGASSAAAVAPVPSAPAAAENDADFTTVVITYYTTYCSTSGLTETATRSTSLSNAVTGFATATGKAY